MNVVQDYDFQPRIEKLLQCFMFLLCNLWSMLFLSFLVLAHYRSSIRFTSA